MSTWALTLSFLIPIGLGAIGVLQGGLNREISNHIGVAQATLISNILTVLICIGFYLFVKAWPQFFSEFIRVQAPLSTYKWWYVFPAIFGFLIVAGLPIAIAQIGAVKVITLLIIAQVITAVLWDFFAEGIPLSSTKVIGMVLGLISALLITFSK